MKIQKQDIVSRDSEAYQRDDCVCVRKMHKGGSNLSENSMLVKIKSMEEQIRTWGSAFFSCGLCKPVTLLHPHPFDDATDDERIESELLTLAMKGYLVHEGFNLL
ncbi:hypothetical protein L6452_32931 [Arctium lappa]|uniref:Uncharacterized protein n=1 Tax=Arctium lappa TaxID=4217 RepID=A0ACB8Z6V5_ARCLA|nr:hypothetical protein L6452_32931 [Arctium lappa]